MRHWPAEIALNFDHLAITERQNFGVSESLGTLALAVIGDEDPITFSDQVYELELGDHGAVGPAAFEVRRPV